MSEEREGFLTRWSRKKRKEADEPAEPVSVTQETLPEEPEFDISTLPDLDSLTETSDAMAFLQKGVPDALKNAALRKIWSADISIRDYIGPVEMGWDFNDPNGIPGFGPLAPDTDMAALLRQAIGEADPAVQPPETELAQAQITGDDEAEIKPPGIDSGELTEVKVAETQPVPAETIQKPVPTEHVEAESVPFQAIRRHGGALPSF